MVRFAKHLHFIRSLRIIMVIAVVGLSACQRSPAPIENQAIEAGVPERADDEASIDENFEVQSDEEFERLIYQNLEEVEEEKSAESPKAQPPEPKSDEPKRDEPKQSDSPSKPASSEGGASKKQGLVVLEKGFLTPTIYFFPLIDEDRSQCQSKGMVNLYGAKGVVLAKLCKSTFALCSEQGSCAVVQNDRQTSYNIIGLFNGQERYFQIKETSCVLGYGVRGYCLDPFYTLAADLDLYQPGDVIFVPAVVGLQLPDGSRHNGYFIVRDEGRGVKGKGRFDFFSGVYSWKDSRNPFVKLGLGSGKNKIPYFKIGGHRKTQVQRWRVYPDFPRKKVKTLEFTDN